MILQGKNILITGGTRGLGLALASAFADVGANIAIVSRHADDLSQIKSDFIKRGIKVHTIEADVGEKDQTYQIAALAFEALGSVDILINNAATLGVGSLRLLLDTDCEDLESAIQTNLLGSFRLMKAVAGSMFLQGGGDIVNVSSDAARTPYPTWGAYSVSKAGLDILTEIMAKESEASGIRFTRIDPGEMDTKLHEQALPEANKSELSDPVSVANAFVEFLSKAKLDPSYNNLVFNRTIGFRKVL
jgi:NAD(P)-dependent dehydrogenase (short-subunit alcohol dehydrogenase family)